MGAVVEIFLFPHFLLSLTHRALFQPYGQNKTAKKWPNKHRPLGKRTICSAFWEESIPESNEQARKSSEDTHFTGYARFEKVWAR